MSEWKGKRVVVVGLGVSNIPLIRFLLRKGAIVEGRDKKSPEKLGERYFELRGLGVDCLLGANYLNDLDKFDTVFLSPGIPKNLPELRAIQGVVPFSSETELVLRYAKAPIFGITGSSGKTTTTTLVGEMLKASGLPTYVGGNIGVPLIEEIESIPEHARIVLELSSFQLELLNQSPHGALITNISENHLDIHGTMDNYIQAKKQIFTHQTDEDIAVFNFDDPLTKEMGKESTGSAFYFSKNEPVPRGTFTYEKIIYFRNGPHAYPVIDQGDIRLRGEHNLENVLAASLLAHLAGADWHSIRGVAKRFTGVPHRLEKVQTIKGVTYYNDSIATTPTRAIAGVKSFKEPVILIAGGYDKLLSFDEFADVVTDRTVKTLILFGATAKKIQKCVEETAKRKGNPKKPQIVLVSDLEDAVGLTSQIANRGDIVLLSPACASFDMYNSFQDRGQHFRDLVARLLES